MIILGINAYHGDASACIFVDQKLIAAVEEERFTRVKHAAGFPINSIKYCLKYSNKTLSDVDHICINRNPKQKIFQKLIFASKKLLKFNFLRDRISNLKKINSIKNELDTQFNERFNGKIHYIDHHTSHIASSVFFSKFDETNFISVDGFGDFASTVIGFYDGEQINKVKEVLFPHSLGLFYTAMTQFLGFMNYGDEYKVMGLAPYGKVTKYEEITDLIIKKKQNLFELNLKYFNHHKGNVEMSWLDGEPKIGKVYSEELSKLIGRPRELKERISQDHMDIAASTQRVYEDMLIYLANSIYEYKEIKNLCISGGCGMNSVANGKIKHKTNYEKIYIPPSPGDSGGAIGSASIILKKYFQEVKDLNDNPYLGPSYTNEEIKSLLDSKNDVIEKTGSKIYKFDANSDLFSFVAGLLTNQKVVGFFRGRMEWGPRALGNRSILADPRNPNIKELLNNKIKKRETFRPFAPSIISEKVKDWFELDEDVPFMSQVLLIKKEMRNKIPAVTHVDGTGRLQTVSKEINLDYYNLIQSFNSLTNVPIILNTSFNENEPIVNTPGEALDCFLRTKMDCLALENYLILRQ